MFVLIILVFIWFIFIFYIFKRIKKFHYSTYFNLGQPSLFWNNSFKNNFLFLKFLFSRSYKILNDSVLKRLCDSLIVILCIYVILFFYFIFYVG